jgi:thioredoxin-like negative regulator of GroEL
MKEDWEQLGGEYEGSSVLIGDADCTASGKELCEKNGVSGYPTIKYFKDGADAQDYQGGRSFDDLKKFVQDELEAKCDIAAPAECTDKEKKYIEKMKAKPAEDQKKQLTRLDAMKGDKMKAELKLWLSQRLRILTQLTA